MIRTDDDVITYAELDRTADEISEGLIAGFGAGPSTRIATMMSNGPAALLAWFGIERTGAVEVPINTALHGRLLADQLERSRADLVVVEAAYRDTVVDALASCGSSAGVQVVDEACSQLRTAGRGSHRQSSDSDAAMILFTSGTTGPSKGVVLSHRSTMRLAAGIVEHVGLGSADVLYTTFPLFHIAARFVSVMAAMVCDGEVVVHKRFSASRFWQICRDESVTAIHYLGSLPMMLYHQPTGPGDRDHEVRVAYGAGLPPAVFASFEQRFGVRAHELYGSTEQGMVAINRAGASRIGTCGRAVDDVDLEIHDEEGRPVPAGDPGEIVVRPRRAGIFFSGYDGMPDATLEAWQGLWFRTGDLGRLDADGFLSFGGRIKEAIRRRGENISAWEVERAVSAFPDVDEVAAVGVPSELGEEELLVVVVGSEAIEWPRLVRHCRAELPHHAVPRFYRLVDALPMTETGRVRRHEIAEVTPDTWDLQDEEPGRFVQEQETRA